MLPTTLSRPNEPVTRAQLAKIIVLAAHLSLLNSGTHTFIDVTPGFWAYRYIETAYAHNILGGYELPSGEREFRPGNDATRAQLTKMLFQAFGSPALEPSKPSDKAAPAGKKP